MTRNPLIGLQKDVSLNSFFVEITKGKKYFLIGVISVISAGIISLLASLVIWSYQSYSYNYYNNQNKYLKNELIAALDKQHELTGLVYRISQAERNLRLSYGLQNKDLMAYGIGGLQSPDELFLKLASPLQQKYSQLKFTKGFLQHHINLASKHFKQLQSYLSYMDDIWKHTPVIFPSNGRLTSKFGYRIHPISGLYRFHFGVDIAAPKWTEVYAAADGKIVSTKYSPSFGRTVSIDHGNGFTTKYAHLEKQIVEKGQLVKRYELIGYIGNTGITTGNHLHYEVHRDGHPKNPRNYMLPDDIMVD